MKLSDESSRRACGVLLPILLGGVGCARGQVGSPSRPPVRVEAPGEPPSGGEGRTLTIPVPSGLGRDTEYTLSACRAACDSGSADRVVIHVRLERASETPCVPLGGPAEPSRTDDEVLEEMLGGEGDKEVSPERSANTSDTKVVERGATKLLGIPGEHVVYRERAEDSGRTRTVFRAVASRVNAGPKWVRRFSCVTVNYNPTREHARDLATFRAILASLGERRAPAPPRGFIRAPFGDAQVDLPEGLTFQRIAFAGEGGFVVAQAAVPGRVPSDLSAWLGRDIARENAAVLEPNSSRPLLGGTVERARVRAQSPPSDRRAAVVRLPQRDPILFESRIPVGSETALAAEQSAFDDARWMDVVLAMAPLLERKPE